jgi:hypothetical protein
LPSRAPTPIPTKPPPIGNSIEAVQDGRIHIEKVNAAFLGADGSKAGLDLAIANAGSGNVSRNICEVHGAGADLFA